MQEGIDFKFRDDLIKEKTDTVPIELMIDFYSGIVYRYEKMQIVEQDNQAIMKFDYTILESGKLKEKNLRKDQRFHEILGVILNKMLLDAAEWEQTREDMNARRTDDTQEYIEES